MNTQPCEHCFNINIYTSGSTNKPNTHNIGLNGTIIFYKGGLKKYVKSCCFMAYYVGREGLGNYMINQNFGASVKTKAPKYVITDNDAFIVYEIIFRPQETIPHPEYNETYKLEINRYMSMDEYKHQYTIATKAAFNKKIKSLQERLEDVEMEEVVEETRNAHKPQYVYLIQERTAVVANQAIYKIGRTEQPNFDRFRGYGKGYKVLLHISCDDCKSTEHEIMKIFKSKYRHATEYGNEYFEGDHKKMIKSITNIICG